MQRFQKTLQYARSKVDYVISEFIYMLPSDMNLWIGKVKNCNNRILISSPSFKIGTTVKINLDGEKDKPDVKSKREETIKTDVKMIRTKPYIKKEEMMKNEPDTHEEEKTALILGMTSIFTVWWLFK